MRRYICCKSYLAFKRIATAQTPFLKCKIIIARYDSFSAGFDFREVHLHLIFQQKYYNSSSQRYQTLTLGFLREIQFEGGPVVMIVVF